MSGTTLFTMLYTFARLLNQSPFYSLEFTTAAGILTFLIYLCVGFYCIVTNHIEVLLIFVLFQNVSVSLIIYCQEHFGCGSGSVVSVLT